MVLSFIKSMSLLTKTFTHYQPGAVLDQRL